MASFTPLIMFGLFALMIAISWYIKAYNRFIKYRNRIEETWSGIEVALKRRFNLIPNLVRAVQGYEDHESELLQKKSPEHTDSSDVSNRMEEESKISKSIGGLLALAEAYPDLKASENFLMLQRSLSEIEEDIQKARNQFNQSVRLYNTQVESFPSNWIAQKYGFQKADYFTLELATQRELPEVNFTQQEAKTSSEAKPKT